MSQLLISDLNFLDSEPKDKSKVNGKGGGLTPFPSTDIATAVDNQFATGLSIQGTLENGFNISTLSVGSATGAAASAASVFGEGSAFAFSQVLEF